MNGSTTRRSAGQSVLADQCARYARGESWRVEQYIALKPELEGDQSALLDCIYNEICLEENAGFRPSREEYAARFPHLSSGIQAMFDVHYAFRSQIPFVPHLRGESTSEDAQDCVGVSILESRFRVQRQLGQGQFGTVWLALDLKLGRMIALKVARDSSADADRVLLREAKFAARLRHPNIVPVYELGEEHPAYIVSTFIDGKTLEEMLQIESQLPARKAAKICQSVLSALEHAHSQGVVHRDLKPSNVIVDGDGTAWVTDFGLAKQTDSETLSLGGDFVGTPAYMSPEQAQGQPIGPSSDIFSVGVILYELLTGQRPFASKFPAIVHEIVKCTPPRPSQVCAAVEPALEAICLRAMERLAENRYPTAGSMASDLQNYLDGQQTEAGGKARTFLRKITRRQALGTLALGCATFATGTTFVRISRSLDGSTRRVRIATEPSGASIVAVPLDVSSGVPLPDAAHPMFLAGDTVRLVPGDYLLVVEKDGLFHEVNRRVPQFDEHDRGAQKHLYWELGKAGQVDLPLVTLPRADVSAQLAFVEGGTFEMGSESPLTPKHVRTVPSFLVGAKEISVLEYKSLYSGKLPSRMDRHVASGAVDDGSAMCFVSYDEAIAYAEETGTRLLDEVEYEYVARRNADEILRQISPGPDSFGRAGEPSADVLISGVQVYGLRSNVAEWTSSWAALYPQYKAEGLLEHYPPRERMIVRGGDLRTVRGNASTSVTARDPTRRTPVWRYTWSRGLGFRCARSLRPRTKPSDFPRPA